MSLLRQITRGLRALARREVVGAELDDEVRDYYERARAELEAQGLSPQEAARAARLGLGDEGRAREQLGSFGWENVVETTLADLRHSLRRLARAPGFTLVTVVTLALGIGASTAIYSAVIPILFESLPYPRADRLVMLSDYDVRGGGRLAVTYGTYEELASRGRSFDRLAATDFWQPALSGDGDPERLEAQFVTTDFFRVLGISPALGRDFEAADDVAGAPLVAVVSERLARRRFGSVRAILDQSLTLDGNAFTVIGVMPDDFENVLSPSAEVWVPRRFRSHAPFDSGEWGHHMQMIGRLADGVSIDRARQEILEIGAAASDEFPRPSWAALDAGMIVEPLQAAVTSSVRPALLAILGAVLLLLVIACANVTNLLLARGALQRNELAVRAALGAGRGRLARQLLAESLLLAFLGGAAGLVVAAIGVRAIVALAPAGLPRLEAVGLDLPAFVFALGATLVVGLAVGFVPAFRGAGSDLRLDLQSQARATRGGQQRLRRALVVSEVALALVILAGTGLLLRSVERILSTAPGFDSDNVLSMQIVTTGRRFDSDEHALQYFGAVLEAVRAVPGVEDAALTSQLPLSGEYDAYGPEFESAPRAVRVAETETGALRYVVTPSWFGAMRIPLIEGRLLDSRDRPGAAEAVVISESLARRYFGDADPIGQRVRFGPEMSRTDVPAGTIVGVVGDVKQSSLALTPPGAFYVAMGQWVWVDVVQSLVVRAAVDPAALVQSVERAIWSVDPSPPIVRISTMDDLVAASEGQRRFVLTVFGVFAVAALVLAAVGIYGVIAGSVTERTREIGLRAALGASPARILGLVVRQGMALTGLGIVIGLIAAFAATRAIATLLFGVTALDPITYGGVIALLAAVSLLACAVPAWNASRVDPTTALRTE